MPQHHISQADLVHEIGYFVEIWEYFREERHCVETISGLHILSEALPIILIYIREAGKYSRNNRCLSWWYIIIFPGLTWCPTKLIILLEIEEFVFWKIHWIDQESIRYSGIGTSTDHSTYKRGQDMLKQQCMHVIMTRHRISQADLVPNIQYFAWNLRVVLGGKTLWRDHRGISYTIKVSSNHSYIY